VRLWRKGQPSPVALLDAGVDVVTHVGPWLAVLWLTALPARLLLADFLVELVTLGKSADVHGRYLLGLAYATLALWLLSLYGRQVFVRACRRALEAEETPRLRGLRVPPGELAGAVGAALLVELTFWALLFTGVVPLAMVVEGGLAAVAAPRAGPRPLAGLREMAAASARVVALGCLLLFFLLALGIAALNLHLLFALSVWLLTSVAPLDAPLWGRVLTLSNPLYVALLGVGATLVLEPFWLATLTVHVERQRAQTSGEDLRQTFEEIRRETARDAA
jgi:hypothetical protein